jgi:uncharacterized coiled-coil protein SlyX
LKAENLKSGDAYGRVKAKYKHLENKYLRLKTKHCDLELLLQQLRTQMIAKEQRNEQLQGALDHLNNKLTDLQKQI